MDITDIVNDKYWLGYAKKNIDGAEAALKDAASTLNKLVATFWGIYTTAFTAGSIAGKVKVDNAFELILFIMPIPLLMIGYIITTRAQLPGLSTEEIDPRIPEDVQKFYNLSVKEKKKQLKWAFGLIIAAAVSLTIALSSLNIRNSNQASSTTPTRSTVPTNTGGGK
ncbi:MAG: hypothetical protein V4577_23245 [Bacteroidota bacterium]